MKRRIEIIYEIIQIDTSTKLQEGRLDELGIDAFTLALDTDFQRANISKDMNTLWKEGKLIKKTGRPTLYICRKSIEEYYPDVYIDSLLPSQFSFEEKKSDDSLEYTNLEKLMQIIPFQNQIHDTIISLNATDRGLPVILESQQEQSISVFFEVLKTVIEQIGTPKYTFISINYFEYNDIADFISDVKAKSANKNKVLLFENFDKADNKMIGYMYNLVTGMMSSNSVNNKFIFTISDKSNIMIDALYRIIPYKFTILGFYELDFVKKTKLINYTLKEFSKFFNRNISVESEVFAFFFSLSKDIDFNSIFNYLLIIISKLAAESSGNILITYETVLSRFPLKHDLVDYNFGFSNAFYDKTDNSNIDEVISDMNLSMADKLLSALTSISFKISSMDKDITSISQFFSSDAFMENPKNSQWIFEQMKKVQYFFSEDMELHSLSRSNTAKFTLLTYATYINNASTKEEDSEVLPSHLLGLSKHEILKKPLYSRHDINLIENLVVSLTRSFESTEIFLILLLKEPTEFDLYKKVIETLLSNNNYSIIISDDSKDDLTKIESIISNQRLSKAKYSYLILTDNYSVYKKREVISSSIMSDIQFMYPLTIPLIDSCISLIKQGSSIKDFSEINKVTPLKKTTINDSDEISSFIMELEEKVLKKDLKFLDTNKSTMLLLDSLKKICNTLNIPVDKRIIIKFITHSSFMIERLLQNDAMNFDNLQNYYKKNLEEMNYIKKELLSVERAFNINISPSELAFLNEIFIDYKS